MPSELRRGPAVVAGVAVAASIWVAALVTAPYVVTHDRPGSAAFLAATGVYAVGAVVCHQQPSRSFHFWDAQLPVCARCAGLYAGAPGGLLLALLLLPAPGRARRHFAPEQLRDMRRLLIAAAVPTVFTVVVEVPNAVRAMSALPLGLAVAWIAARTAREVLDA
ncbi:MAG: DUF2085 domain-containing protein [Acidobacteria bacterium]|nr:DUF2085 domain-containing protein [Acidobacteriota bacterium]